MEPNRALLRRIAFGLTFAAAVSALVSIAACQILIGLSLLGLLAAGERFRFPPLRLPLALFAGGTLLSLAFSADPAGGLPQIRKLFVFLTVPLVYTAFRRAAQVRYLVFAWIGVGTGSALVGLAQFVQKWIEADELGVPIYVHYVGARMTGFMSHWQTFGGEMMLVFLVLASWVLFSAESRSRLIIWIGCGGVLALAIVLGFTRNIWLGSFVGGLILLWFWNRKLILAVPVVLAVVIAAGPPVLRERVTSFVRPQGEVDSNRHRIVTFRTGLRMIQAHPVLGVGPEQVRLRFEEFVPPDVPRPLPEGWYGHLHNIYLHYAAERGIVTMLFLVWLLVKIIMDFARALRRGAAPEHRYLYFAGVSVTAAIMTSGMFELNLGDTEVLTLYLAIVACGYSLIRAETQPASRRVESQHQAKS